MAEVRCPICKDLFTADTIARAMWELHRHEFDEHGMRRQGYTPLRMENIRNGTIPDGRELADREKREAGYYDRWRLTPRDLEFLQRLKISTV